MKLDLDQKDLVCLVLGSKPEMMEDAEYLVETGYMVYDCSGTKFGCPNYKWKTMAIENLSDVALYGLYNIVKRGNIREHYQRFNQKMKRRG